MRTISFNIDGGDATASVTAILLSLSSQPRPHSSKSSRYGVKFDRDGDTFTVAWRREPSVWLVSFRPVNGHLDRTRQYRSPVDAAQAIIGRKHTVHSEPVYLKDSALAG